jgi:hypothetical protein
MDEAGLLRQAEAANDRAKALCKNCVVTELDT